MSKLSYQENMSLFLERANNIKKQQDDLVAEIEKYTATQEARDGFQKELDSAQDPYDIRWSIGSALKGYVTDVNSYTMEFWVSSSCW